MMKETNDTTHINKNIALLEADNKRLKKSAENTIRGMVITSIVPYLFIGLILLISLIVGLTDKIDSIDQRTKKSQRILRHVLVWDEEIYGFRVVIATTDKVSEERGKEINERQHIRTSLWKLIEDAPVHFGGGLAETDIYDFADFALQYVTDPDICIHNIFAAGFSMEFYIGPNPNIPNSAVYMDRNTEQGNLYLSRSDIYCRDSLNEKIYRYWKCYGIHATSSKEERFSHFSENERETKQ